MRYEKIAFFQLMCRFISEMIQDMVMVTTKDEQKLVCDLSNGAINDLEWHLTQISMAHHYLTLNISGTIQEYNNLVTYKDHW